jgi:AcrR family transcriptional regulator
MTRSYTLKRRAEQQADTRRRIVQAAMDLHGTVGPARTSLSMIAERAGVQRNTLYAHFPDERSLGLACSGLFFEREPPPDPTAWSDGDGRLEAGLAEIYAWYARASAMLSSVLSDAEHHAPTREILELRMKPVMAGWRESLAGGLSRDAMALLELALSFHSWRTLARGAGLGAAAAAELMARAVTRAGGARC